MSIKFQVLITRRLPSVALNILKERCVCDVWDSDDIIPNNILIEKAKGKDGILCLLTDKINKNLIDSAGDQLEVVSTMSVGVDHLDLMKLKQRNIKVGYTPDVLTSATAELTVGLLLATSRKIVEGTKAVKDGSWGTWKPMWMCGPTLEGSTVGLFGLGRIGMAVLNRLKPFGVKRFIYNTTSRKSKDFETDIGATYETFQDLLKKSDFLISCCALTPETKEIFNKKAFGTMKKSAIFINIARGGVVNQDDLYKSLKVGEIQGAGLDVTTPEPLPTNHPLLQLDNCVILPHIGSATYETRTKMAVLAANNLIQGLCGQTMDAQFRL